MKLALSLVLAFFGGTSYSQLWLDVSREGIATIHIDEPSSRFHLHPSNWKLIERDTTKFGRLIYNYYPADAQAYEWKTFPPSNWGENYEIVDSTNRKLKLTFEHSVANWHGPSRTSNYEMDVFYDKHGRLEKTEYMFDFEDEDGETNERMARWKYQFKNDQIQGVKGYIDYNRDDEGRLLYFIQGHSDLTYDEIYDSLNHEFENDKSTLFHYSHINKFIGVKYKNNLPVEYIIFGMDGGLNKVTFFYDTVGRLERIEEFYEGARHNSTEVFFNYQQNSDKLSKITHIEYADNWPDGRITLKHSQAYVYDNELISTIIKNQWRSYAWDNLVYEKPPIVSEEIHVKER